MNADRPRLASGSAVLVTGCSTGIGRATAFRLAAQGLRVFATVRREQDGVALQHAMAGDITPVLLDVTEHDAVRATVTRVEAALGESRLLGLINNAGVALTAPVEHLDVQAWRHVLEVNLLGVIGMTQAFLPLLRRDHGRVINVSSMSGRVAFPFMAPYSASKFALEAMTDALRLELRHADLPVILIEPGFVRTPLIAKGRDQATRDETSLPATARQHYGRAIQRSHQVVAAIERRAPTPEQVAELITRALHAARPKRRYRIGIDASLIELGRLLLPDSFMDALIARLLHL